MVGCAEGDAVAVAYDQHLLIRDREAALCLRRRRLRRRRRSLRRCCGRGSRRRYRQGRRRCRGGRRRGAANAPVFRASAGRKHRRHDPEGDTERGAAAERRGHRARLTAPRVAPRRDGEIGRRDGLKIRWAKHPWGFESPSRYQGDPVSAATSTETSRAPHRIQRGTSLPTGPQPPSTVGPTTQAATTGERFESPSRYRGNPVSAATARARRASRACRRSCRGRSADHSCGTPVRSTSWASSGPSQPACRRSCREVPASVR